MCVYDRFIDGLYLRDTKVISSANDLTISNVPEGITDIMPDAFSNARNLQEVTIPSSVRRIGSEALPVNHDENWDPITLKINYQGDLAQWLRIEAEFLEMGYQHWNSKQLYI
jgi:hypothetical protein